MNRIRKAHLACILATFFLASALAAILPACSGEGTGADLGEFRIDRRLLPVTPNGESFRKRIDGKGGLPPYVDWAVTRGSLPGGLTLDTVEGRISGRIDATDGLYPFVLEATDSDIISNTDDETFVIRVGEDETSGPLASNAAAYERLLAERHAPSGVVLTLVNPEAEPGEREWRDYELGARLTGYYLAAAALRYASTESADDRGRMIDALEAVDALIAISGSPGLLARGLARDADQLLCCDDPGDEGCTEDRLCGGSNFPETHAGTGDFAGYHWVGDAGRLDYAAVVFGLSIAASVSDTERAVDLVGGSIAALVDHVWANGMRIIGIDGKTNTDGNLSSGPERKGGLNALMTLHWTLAAYRATGEDRFADRYAEAIANGLRDRIASDPDVYRGYETDWREVNAAMLTYFDLIRIEPDDAEVIELRDRFQTHLWQSPTGEVADRRGESERSPLYNLAFGIATDLFRPPDDFETLVDEDAFDNAPRLNRAVDLTGDPSVPADPEHDGWAAEVIAIDDRPPVPWAWEANPYLLAGGADDGAEFSGVDYLLPYWMGRYFGRIAGEW